MVIKPHVWFNTERPNISITDHLFYILTYFVVQNGFSLIFFKFPSHGLQKVDILTVECIPLCSKNFFEILRKMIVAFCLTASSYCWRNFRPSLMCLSICSWRVLPCLIFSWSSTSRSLDFFSNLFIPFWASTHFLLSTSRWASASRTCFD